MQLIGPKEKQPLLIKSKERVQKHGEVFTPEWMVKKMLSYPDIQRKLQDRWATFLEPSAGEGAFLMEILRQKLAAVNMDPASRGVHWQYHTLWALMSIYGIEYMEDNLAIARENMLQVFSENYRKKTGRELCKNSDLYHSAKTIIELNIVQGDTLTHKNKQGEWILFQAWERDKKRKRSVIRRPFTFDSLFKQENLMDSLFADTEPEEMAASIDGPKKIKNIMQIQKGEDIMPKSRAEQSRAEQSRAEQSRAEQSRAA